MTEQNDEPFDIVKFLNRKRKPLEVAGTFDSGKRYYVYIQDDGKIRFTKFFDTLFDTMCDVRPGKTDGGIMNGNCTLITPDNILFHCISISGDR